MVCYGIFWSGQYQLLNKHENKKCGNYHHFLSNTLRLVHNNKNGSVLQLQSVLAGKHHKKYNLSKLILLA